MLSNRRPPAYNKPARVFAALGDTTRLQLVRRLMSGESRPLTQLADGLKLTRQGVTRHLRVLERAGVVKSMKHGRECRYTYVPHSVEQARSYLDDISRQWDDALGRLKNFVESQ